VVVATPGRLADVLRSGDPHMADLGGLRVLVLDEADRMAEQGAAGDLGDALACVRSSAPLPTLQTFVSSATLTLPPSMRGRVRKGGGGAGKGGAALDAVMAAVHRELPAPHDPFLDLVPPQGVRLTPRHYAYLKVSEGCNHRCTFCIIPSLRGDLVSRPLGDILTEAERLVEAGVREILVLAQDTSAYGLDLRYRPDFWKGRPLTTDLVTLARTLGELPTWVRMHYVYPYPHVDDLIPLMADGVILPYLDMPLQHGSERVLKAMRRPAAAERVLERLARWRAQCPDLVLRSTFIVGFPGETAAEFETLLDFIRAARLDRVGCFPYSAVAGAAANALPDPVPEDVKLERLGRFMDVQAEISRDKLAARIGQRLTVLVDTVDDAEVIARGPGDAPEIDGVVIIPGAWELDPGDFVEVTVTDSGDHDLWAEPVED
jgi:ribosomal protein S12 methylthiotransferase